MTAGPGGMTCFEVLAQLSDLLDGALPAALRARVEAHVVGCGDCARFGGAVGRLVAGLRAGARPPVGEDCELPRDVVSRLDAAWQRARHGR